jgi:hypothetical protein
MLQSSSLISVVLNLTHLAANDKITPMQKPETKNLHKLKHLGVIGLAMMSLAIGYLRPTSANPEDNRPPVTVDSIAKWINEHTNQLPLPDEPLLPPTPSPEEAEGHCSLPPATPTPQPPIPGTCHR